MRETGMTAYEMMLSESQERMLMVLKPEEEIGRARVPEMGARLRGGRRHHRRKLVVRHGGAVKADIPLSALADAAPVYERP